MLINRNFTPRRLLAPPQQYVPNPTWGGARLETTAIHHNLLEFVLDLNVRWKSKTLTVTRSWTVFPWCTNGNARFRTTNRIYSNWSKFRNTTNPPCCISADRNRRRCRRRCVWTVLWRTCCVRCSGNSLKRTAPLVWSSSARNLHVSFPPNRPAAVRGVSHGIRTESVCRCPNGNWRSNWIRRGLRAPHYAP